MNKSQMRQMFFDRLEERESSSVALMFRFGEGTEYEAIGRVFMDDETGQWDGFFVFKDERFSPIIYDPGYVVPFKHQTPSAGNGVLAHTRAKTTWETLIGIFKALRAEGGKHNAALQEAINNTNENRHK